MISPDKVATTGIVITLLSELAMYMEGFASKTGRLVTDSRTISVKKGAASFKCFRSQDMSSHRATKPALSLP
jgi:hypothetical protein